MHCPDNMTELRLERITNAATEKDEVDVSQDRPRTRDRWPEVSVKLADIEASSSLLTDSWWEAQAFSNSPSSRHGRLPKLSLRQPGAFQSAGRDAWRGQPWTTCTVGRLVATGLVEDSGIALL